MIEPTSEVTALGVVFTHSDGNTHTVTKADYESALADLQAKDTRIHADILSLQGTIDAIDALNA
jgi:hypothetical protein